MLIIPIYTGDRFLLTGEPQVAKASAELRSLARSHTATAINTLVSIMRQKKAPAAARVTAAQALLDRGWGKPVQSMALTDPTGEHDRLAYLLAEIDGKTRGLPDG